MLSRYLEAGVRKDLKKKMVFLSGPRQVGKTSFAKSFLSETEKSRYLNWDYAEDRLRMMKGEWPTGSGLIVLDEIHKYRRWRQMVKGLFDKRKDEVSILVTGCARLDYYRYGGDSLQGRYHFYRMHPLTVKELGIAEQKPLLDLLNFGGFPEPYLARDPDETRRWSREHRLRVVREDIQDLERVSEINLMELLSGRLPELVGSPLSMNSIREDLQVAHRTISRWVDILERLYYLFRIYPFGAPKLRAVKKEAKHYHYDWTQVAEESFRFENMLALHLLKWCHYMIDTEGREFELRYFRDIDGRETDFVLMENRKPCYFIEAKSAPREAGKGLRYLVQRFPGVKACQVYLHDDGADIVDRHGVRHCGAIKFLQEWI